MSERNEPSMLWPTYALRAWLTALIGQMERAKDDIEKRLEAHEKELARLRGQKERSAIVITSLREAIGAVDGVLHRTRDTELNRDSESAERTDHDPSKPESRKLNATGHEKPGSGKH
jgi:septal ring factor EnvC (AmiA/AmiB activator)